MPDQKTDTEDILAHLRGRNRYVYSNTVANVSNGPISNGPLSNGPLQPLSQLQIQATAHQIAHQINNHHKWPSTIKHVLYIIKAKHGNESLGDRTKICTIECVNQPLAIIDAIQIKFRSFFIISDAAKWVFGYVIGKEKISREIVSFNCQTDDIMWDEFSHFTLREPPMAIEAPNSKSERNKRDYKLKASMMDDGDGRLRDLFEKQGLYNQIKKNTKLFIKAKYKAGVDRISDGEIIDMITDGLKANEEKEKKRTNTNNTESAAGGWQQNFNQMMQLCMMQMMNNMTNSVGHQQTSTNNTNNSATIPPPVPALPPPAPALSATIPPHIPVLPGLATEPRTVANRAYTPARGTSTNTSRSRHTPIAKTDLKSKLPKL